MVAVSELEADDRMRHPSNAPVIYEEVNTSKCCQIDCLRFPIGNKVGRASIVEIPEVVNCHLVAINFRPGRLRDIGFPKRVVRRVNRQSPRKYPKEEAEYCCRSLPQRSDCHKQAEDGNHVNCGRKSADLLKRKHEIQGTGCPKRESQQSDQQNSVERPEPKQLKERATVWRGHGCGVCTKKKNTEGEPRVRHPLLSLWK